MKKYLLCLLILLEIQAQARVENPVMFIGEVVKNATVGAPLIADANGKLASGITSTELTFSSNITTTSASAVVLTGMTTTPAAGTYLVLFSSWLTHSNGNATITMSYFVGGVQRTDTIRTIIPFVGALSAITQDIPVSINAIITVNGSQAIAVEWLTSTGTATAHHGTFDLLRIL